MALTFTSVYPRRLVLSQARAINSDSWVNIPGVEAISWRAETQVAYDYDLINTTGGMKLYLTLGTGRGYGRKMTGVLWSRDCEALEALVAASHLNSAVAAIVDPLNNLQFQFKFNTGLNTNNFRYVTKLIKPIVCGVGYGTGEFLSTLSGVDVGKRTLFPLPFRVMIGAANTHFNTTNINAAGVYTSWSNS